MKRQPSIVGINVRKYRNAAGITQTALAKKAGLSLYTIAKMEIGSNNDPKVMTMKKIAVALGTTIDELVKE